MTIKIIQSEIEGIYEKDGNSLNDELNKCITIDDTIDAFAKHSIIIIDENGMQFSYNPAWVIYQFIN